MNIRQLIEETLREIEESRIRTSVVLNRCLRIAYQLNDIDEIIWLTYNLNEIQELTNNKNLQKEYLGNSYNSGGGKRGILYRLSMEKPCLTLLCTPSQKQTERCHPLEEIPLTIREYARIQTFTDDYIFIGSMSSQYKQIGNAVPVNLATYIGRSLIEIL